MQKLTPKDIEIIAKRRIQGDRVQDIADDFNVCRGTIYYVTKNKTKHQQQEAQFPTMMSISLSVEQEQWVRMEAKQQNISLSAYLRQLIDNANTNNKNKGGN